jgi:hypothetical protein
LVVIPEGNLHLGLLVVIPEGNPLLALHPASDEVSS